MMRYLIAATLVFASGAYAQNANDPSAKLREVLPVSIRDHVLATIADARSHSLPAAALEQQALRLERKGAKPADIQASVDRSAENMKTSKAALRKSGRKPTSNEIVAGSELIGRGVSGSAVSEFARGLSPKRPLAVALYATGRLMDRGLKSDAALEKVHARLMENATDKQLTSEANETAVAKRPATATKAGGLAHRPAVAPGAAIRPVTPGRPTSPGKHG
jgi:hypothetical protein